MVILLLGNVGTSGGCLQLNFIALFLQATMLLMFHIYVFEGIVIYPGSTRKWIMTVNRNWDVCQLTGGNGIYVQQSISTRTWIMAVNSN